MQHVRVSETAAAQPAGRNTPLLGADTSNSPASDGSVTAISADSSAALSAESSALPHVHALADAGEHERHVVLRVRRDGVDLRRAASRQGEQHLDDRREAPGSSRSAPAMSMSGTPGMRSARLLHGMPAGSTSRYVSPTLIDADRLALDDVDDELVGRHRLGHVAADERERAQLLGDRAEVDEGERRAELAVDAPRPPRRRSIRDVPSTVTWRSARIGEYTAVSTSTTRVTTVPATTAIVILRLRDRRVNRRTSARSNRRRSRGRP